jgi:hypothetical protein
MAPRPAQLRARGDVRAARVVRSHRRHVPARGASGGRRPRLDERGHNPPAGQARQAGHMQHTALRQRSATEIGREDCPIWEGVHYSGPRRAATKAQNKNAARAAQSSRASGGATGERGRRYNRCDYR